MDFVKGARRRIAGRHLDPDEVRQVLHRLQTAVPHLHFRAWRALSSAEPDSPTGGVFWTDSTRCNIKVDIYATGLCIRSICRRDSGAVSLEDYRFLLNLASEAASLIHASASGPLSLVDFGADAVASDIKERAKLRLNPLPTLQFIRSMSSETYENQRLAYAVVFTRRSSGSGLLAEAYDNKRVKRVTDGFTTALAVDRDGRILELLALTVPASEGTSLQRRPWWSAGLASAAKQRRGIAIALNRNGDLLVLHGGRMVFTQRAGKWRIWSHAAILARLHSLWQYRGPQRNALAVLTYLYHVAIDLSFRRSGGLLVVASSDKSARRMLGSSSDLLGARRRGPVEKAIDKSLSGVLVHQLDRRIVGDLASLDGALIVDRTGTVLGYGAMTKSARSASQGARTRAAIGASRSGVAIKVSSDGDISFFHRGRKAFEI